MWMAWVEEVEFDSKSFAFMLHCQRSIGKNFKEVGMAV